MAKWPGARGGRAGRPVPAGGTGWIIMRNAEGIGTGPPDNPATIRATRAGRATPRRDRIDDDRRAGGDRAVRHGPRPAGRPEPPDALLRGHPALRAEGLHGLQPHVLPD